jgi:hypothetical protein
MTFKHVVSRAFTKNSQFTGVFDALASTYAISNLNPQDIESVLKNVTKDAIDRTISKQDDFVQVFIDAKGLSDPICINKYYVKYKDFPFDQIAHMLQRVDQSKKGALLEGDITIKVYHITK